MKKTIALSLPVVLGSTSLIQLLVTASVLAAAAIAPMIAQGLGVSPGLIGIQISLIYVVATCVSVVAGSLVARFGSGLVSQIALLSSAIGCIGAASGSLTAFVLTTPFIGLGYGLTNPAASQMLARVVSRKRHNIVFSLKQTAVPAGGAVVGLVLPVLAVKWGWQPALGTVALAALIVAIGLHAVRRSWDDDPRPARKQPGIFSAVGMIWRSPSLNALVRCAFCFSAMQLSLMTFVVATLNADLGYSLVTAGLVLSFVQLVGAAARIGWGFLADTRLGGPYALIVAGTLSTCASVSFGFTTPHTPHYLIFAILGIFASAAIGWNGVFLAEVARQASGTDVGRATGGALSLAFAGVIVGPTIFTGLHALTGSFTVTFALMAAFPALGTIQLVTSMISKGRNYP